MTTLDTFLDPAVERLALLAQHELGSTGAAYTTDPRLNAWVKLAYSRIVAYCERPFLLSSVVDKYEVVRERVLLRITPVSSLTQVKIVGYTDALSSSSYSLIYNAYLELDRTNQAFITGEDLEYLPLDLYVTYTGGYSSLDDDDDEDKEKLLNAIALQAFIWMQGSSVFGIKKFSSDVVSAESAGGSIPLDPEVIDMIGHFKYEGEGIKIASV